MTIELRGATKRYGAVHALDGLELEVVDGELLAVMGRSGSGKTTLLRVVAGLEHLDSGTVSVAGRDVTRRPAGERDVALVFQEPALYPHLDVAANIGFGLRARRVARDEVRRRVAEAAAALEVGDLLGRRPGELSGGERQRVALARALVREPVAFLLDEPLSSLDPDLRAAARSGIRALQRRLGTTMLHVTHDPTEAMALGDRVAVLHQGRLEQVGPPHELWDTPATVGVARLFGDPPMNVIAGEVLGADAAWVGVRPEDVVLCGPGEGRVAASVAAVEPLGGDVVATLDVAGSTLVARTARNDAPRPGDEVGIEVADHLVHRFDTDGRALGRR